MAETKSTKNVKVEDTSTVEELNLDKKVTIRSIANWQVGFSRKADGASGDISIPPNGNARLTRNEIITQVQNGNKLFKGIDDYGSHATLIIEDEPTRLYVDFDSEDRKQNVFSNEKVKELFSINSMSKFENAIKTEIRTRAEKYAIINAIKELKLNDFAKIRFIENYTGYKCQ